MFGTLPRDKYKLKQLIGMFGRVVYKENPMDLGWFYFKTYNIIFVIKIESNRNLLFHQDSAIKYVSSNYNGINFDDA